LRFRWQIDQLLDDRVRRKAGDAEESGFLLDASRIGDEECRMTLELEKLRISQWVDQLKVWTKSAEMESAYDLRRARVDGEGDLDIRCNLVKNGKDPRQFCGIVTLEGRCSVTRAYGFSGSPSVLVRGRRRTSVSIMTFPRRWILLRGTPIDTIGTWELYPNIGFGVLDFDVSPGSKFREASEFRNAAEPVVGPCSIGRLVFIAIMFRDTRLYFRKRTRV
jgi:hypothetical protein